MNITTIAVPVTLAAVLSYVFQFAKPLLQRVPGLRPGDATHDDGLRVFYGVLVFLAVGGYELYTAGTPATIDGWLSLLLSLVGTATTMAVAAHYNYQRMSATGAAFAAVSATAAASAGDTADGDKQETDFPPGVPSVAALGLPETTEQAA